MIISFLLKSKWIVPLFQLVEMNMKKKILDRIDFMILNKCGPQKMIFWLQVKTSSIIRMELIWIILWIKYLYRNPNVRVHVLHSLVWTVWLFFFSVNLETGPSILVDFSNNQMNCTFLSKCMSLENPRKLGTNTYNIFHSFIIY